MPRETDVPCPSGLQVRLRSIKGKDLDGLRDKRRLATGEAISKLLDDCTIEVIEPSIYRKLSAFCWADALVGDRMKAMVSLRQATSGNKYDFRVRCRDRDCRKMIDWTLELSTLPIKLLKPESAELFLSGNVFETHVNDTLVKFCLNTGRSQAKLLKLAQQVGQKNDAGKVETDEGRALLGLLGKIVSVEGVTNVLDWLEELDLTEISDLAKHIDEADCGVETTIEVVCFGRDGCGLKQEVELPLDSRFFMQPI